MNRWSWDVLGSVGNAPNRSRAAILEDAYSSLAFGEKLYLVGRTEPTQIHKRQALCRYEIVIEVSNSRWRLASEGRGVTEADATLVS